jgi:RND family efflux transporter MFP subunit
MSRQDVERARVENDEAEASRAQAQADVERARAAMAHLGVDADTGDMILRAPLAGFVLSRDAIPGSVVDAGAPLLTVTDPATLWLDIAATERVAPSLRPNTTVRFTVPELSGETFEASIQTVGGALDPATRTLPVRALVRNPKARLRPQMFATVTVQDGAPRTTVTVPDAAIQMLDERPVVFVAFADDKGGSRFERRVVELGARADGRTQIVRGLEQGAVVVTEGAFAVKSEFARSKMSEG